MTTAASVSFGLVFLFATAASRNAGWAQPAPEDDAIKEAIRRQANVITLRQKLAQASEAEARKDLPAAAKLYDNSHELVLSIGTAFGIEAETAQAVTVASDESIGGLRRGPCMEHRRRPCERPCCRQPFERA